MSDERDLEVVDDPVGSRYELRLDGERAGELQYRRHAGTVVLVHTEIEPSLEGRGFGTRLVRDALDDIRSRRERVVAACPFVATYFRRHPEEGDLLRST